MIRLQDVKEKLLHQSVRQLTRFAAMLALVGLSIMVLSILWPRPLPVMLAMSVGHGFGIAAFLCYLLAVVLDVSRSKAAKSSLPPATNEQLKEG
jgi:hypothetical protein